MKSTREEIKFLEEAIAFSKLCIKNLKQRMKAPEYESKLAEQDAIIAEAEKKKQEITEAFNKAPAELKATERLLRFKKKRLAYLKNLKLINRLKNTVTELAELSKEVPNEDNNNS